jgi:hypothetical protein
MDGGNVAHSTRDIGWFLDQLKIGLLIYIVVQVPSYLSSISIVFSIIIAIIFIIIFSLLPINTINRMIPCARDKINRMIFYLGLSIAVVITSIFIWGFSYGSVIPLMFLLMLLIIALKSTQIFNFTSAKLNLILHRIAAYSIILSLATSAAPIVGEFDEFNKDRTNNALSYQLIIKNECNFPINYEIRGINIDLMPGKYQSVPAPPYILIVAHHGSYISVCDSNGILNQIFKIPPNKSIFISIDNQPLIPGDRKEIYPDKDHVLVIKSRY